MKDWMKVIPAEELATFSKAGFSGARAPGARTALIVVDVTYGFTGSPGLTLEQAIKEYPTACGPASWTAMPKIARLIELFRSLHLPIVFTRSSAHDVPFAGKATKGKRDLVVEPRFNEFPETVMPRAGEWVLEKTKASCFFMTPLPIYLVKESIHWWSYAVFRHRAAYALRRSMRVRTASTLSSTTTAVSTAPPSPMPPICST